MRSSNRIALVLLLLGVMLATLLVRTPTQGAPSAQAAPCVSRTDGAFVFALAGYRANGDGSYTLTWQVTNHGQQGIGYVALGTAGWRRSQPQQGSRYTGELGDYQVEWTNDQGNPGFASVKYETQFAGFSQGATESFTLVVRNFDPAAPIQVQAKTGRTLGTAQFTLSTASCDRTPPTPTPTPFFSPLPTPTSTLAEYTLPAEPVVAACSFTPPPDGIVEEPMIPLSAYAFSAPQVVLTNTAPIGIEQWLPDSERLLVARTMEKGNMLELVNTRTLEITRLVDPNRAIKAPRWLTQDQTAFWLELGTQNIQPGYWVRSFDPPGERRLSEDGRAGGSITHDVSPDGKQVVFLSLPGGTQPFIWNQESKTVRSLLVDLATWRYKKANFLYPFRPFNAHWQPGGEKILFEDGVWLFLFDLTTNHGCEINLQTHSPLFPSVHEASWSPNGRYLLLKIALDPAYTSFQGPYGTVLVLDTYTGEAVQYSRDKLVYGFSWAPDSQTVAMTGLTGQKIGHFNMYGMYLLNIHNGEYRQILSEREVGNGQWSSDGTRLVFQCQDFLPDENGLDAYLDRICVSQVSMNN